MGRRWRKVGVGISLACLVAGTLVVASGGVGGAQSGSDPATILIGSTMPVDATSISFEGNKLALEASVAGFNKRNEDVEFELFFCDGKFDPNAEADCARQFVQRGVVATVGDIAGANPTAVNQILRDAGIPRVGLSMVGLDEFSSPVSFPLSSGPVLATSGVFPVLRDEGITKVSNIAQQLPQTAAIAALWAPAMKSTGIELVNNVQVPLGTTDYTSYISAAQAGGAQGLVCLCTPQLGIPVATTAAQLGTTLPMFLPVLGFSLDDMLGTGYEDWALVDSFPPPAKVNVKTFPNLKQFLADMKAAKSKDLAPGKLTGAMEQGWLALHAIATLTEGQTEVTAASLKSALDSAQDIDMLGIIPPWTPSNPGPTPIFSRVSNPFLYRIEMKNNKMVASKKDPIDLTVLYAG